MEVRNENFSPQSSFVVPMPPEGRRLLPPRPRAAKGGMSLALGEGSGAVLHPLFS